MYINVKGGRGMARIEESCKGKKGSKNLQLKREESESETLSYGGVRIKMTMQVITQT